MGKIISTLMASASLLATGSAMAQTPPPAPAVDAGPLQEIVVTAQKRSENLQRVPITVSAFDQATLTSSGVGASRDLANLVPGLVFNQTRGAGTPFLRGVGQTSGSAGLEPSVAFYFDGVYFPQPGSTLLTLNNVSQIAVLKGPQGTLFGRNSTGGVIQVMTRTPGKETTLDVDAGYGNYQTIQGHLYASTPVTDSIRTSIAVAGLDQGQGWGRNVFLNKEIFTRTEIAAQSKTLFILGPDTDVTANLLYTRNQGYAGSTFAIAEGALANDGRTRYISEYDVATGVDTRLTAEQGLGSLTLEHDLGWARLHALGSAQAYQERSTFVQNGIPLGSGTAIVVPIKDTAHTYTGEFQIRSPDAQDFRWIAGFYAFNDRTNTDSTLTLDTTPRLRTNATQRSTSYAVFGEISKTLLPDTRVTLGGRYTIDHKGVVGQQIAPTGAVVGTFASVSAANGFPDSKTWKEPTYKIAIDHQFGPDAMIFASYNRGFKSGLYNLVTFTNRPADPEKLDAFEVGAKTTLLDRRLRFNASGFYYNYNNIQLRTVLPPASAFILYNAAKAHIKGLDVDFTGAVTDHFNITGGFEVLDAKYVDFQRASCTAPLPAGGNRTFICDRSGQRLVRAPKFTGNIGFDYKVDLGRGRQIELSATDSYNSGFLWEADGRLAQTSYQLVSASLKLTPTAGNLYVRVWGSNLADEHVRSVEGEASSDIYSPGAPRTYGVTVGTSF